MSRFVDRHYVVMALAVLGLAAFNLAFRLGSEFVSEWDESLYAISAWEAVDKGSWIGTTFLGELDYYNTKPPLMVWLVALAYKAFGRSLTSLRLVPAISAWLTVGALQYWTKRWFGPLVALVASLVLATTFGFIYVHSGRSAVTDAPFTLVILLTVATLWAEKGRPGRRAWLGPLLATAFMLRGMAVLMPLALVIVVLISRERGQNTAWRATLSALALFLLPVAAWVVLRYRVDGWRFFERLFMYDFVARSLGPIEGHPGGPLYYLNRDVRLSDQALMLAEQGQLRGQPLYLEQDSRAARFVAGAVVGAEVHPTADRASFLRDSRQGDYLLTPHSCRMPELDVVRSSGRHSLCRRHHGDRGPVR